MRWSCWRRCPVRPTPAAILWCAPAPARWAPILGLRSSIRPTCSPGSVSSLCLLLSLLISVPLLLLLRWLGGRALLLGAGPLFALEIGAAIVAGALTIWVYLATTGVQRRAPRPAFRLGAQARRSGGTLTALC